MMIIHGKASIIQAGNKHTVYKQGSPLSFHGWLPSFDLYKTEMLDTIQ